ncbi:MAG: adenosylmethionine decarboxylase [Nanoarchaeota archaeon]|nr:adenosylmethionine decarboxylase [Nanoarchaeota archaeon]
MVVAGIHVLGNLNGCPVKLLERADIVLNLLNEVVVEAKLNKVGETSHQFDPYGATCVILLAESHISVHTWPENRIAVVDIFTCGKEGDAEKAFDVLLNKFKPKTTTKRSFRDKSKIS